MPRLPGSKFKPRPVNPLTTEANSKLIVNLQEATVKEMPDSMARKLSQLQGSVLSYDAKSE